MTRWFRRLGCIIRGPITTAKWIFYEFTGTEEESRQAEEEAGKELARRLSTTYPLFRNASYGQYLNDMGEYLEHFIHPKRYRFAYSPVSLDSINAFALPGGTIFVTRGLLEFARWQRDEIAFAVAHEIGHVMCRHATDKLVANTLKKGAGHLFRAARIRQAVTSLCDAYVFSEYSRECEFEADGFAARLLLRAHLDPMAGIDFLRRLDGIAQHHQSTTTQRFFSSHPPTSDRIRNIEQAIAAVGKTQVPGSD